MVCSGLALLCLLLRVPSSFGAEYENKCYCIRVEPKVRYDAAMHKAMHDLARTEKTDKFKAYTFPGETSASRTCNMFKSSVF